MHPFVINGYSSDHFAIYVSKMCQSCSGPLQAKIDFFRFLAFFLWWLTACATFFLCFCAVLLYWGIGNFHCPRVSTPLQLPLLRQRVALSMTHAILMAQEIGNSAAPRRVNIDRLWMAATAGAPFYMRTLPKKFPRALLQLPRRITKGCCWFRHQTV